MLVQQANSYDSWGACRVRPKSEDVPPTTTEDQPASPADDTTTDNSTLSQHGTDYIGDGCMTEWVRTNFFTDGEISLGRRASKAECVKAVLDNCPEHDLANVPTSCEHGGECASCWCQHSKGETVANHPSPCPYMTCQIKSKAESIPQDQPQGPDWQADGCMGEWVKTNHFTSDEKNIGAVESTGDCVKQAQQQCPDHDIANVNEKCYNGGNCGECWCQKSFGGAISQFTDPRSSYYSCRTRP